MLIKLLTWPPALLASWLYAMCFILFHVEHEQSNVLIVLGNFYEY